MFRKEAARFISLQYFLRLKRGKSVPNLFTKAIVVYGRASLNIPFRAISAGIGITL